MEKNIGLAGGPATPLAAKPVNESLVRTSHDLL